MSTAGSAIVTGASRGIGRGIATTLGEHGWRVVVNYAGSADAAEETAEHVRQAGGEAETVQADVGAAADRQKLVDQALEAFGGINLLVNNAGITSPDRDKDLLDATEAGFDRVFDTNLKGPHFLTQLVARTMIERAGGSQSQQAVPGTIINISSLSGHAVSTNRADYCMSKAAMGMMTQVWAVRLAEHGIPVFEVRPGIIASDMTAPVKAKYDRLIGEEGLLPIARWGQPEDVGQAVASLAEGALPYSTGETINVDGGFHIRRL